MKCPYCEQEMEIGTIQSPNELAWLKGSKKHLFGRGEFHEDSVVLSRLSFLSGSAVIAHLCRNCRKVLIDYGEESSDLNR